MPSCSLFIYDLFPFFYCYLALKYLSIFIFFLTLPVYIFSLAIFFFFFSFVQNTVFSLMKCLDSATTIKNEFKDCCPAQRHLEQAQHIMFSVAVYRLSSEKDISRCWFISLPYIIPFLL